MPVSTSPPLGFAVVTVTTTATSINDLLVTAGGLVDAVPEGAVMVMIQPRNGDVRYTDDGQNPTTGGAGLGADVFDGAKDYYVGDLAALKLIASSSVPCTLSFYG